MSRYLWPMMMDESAPTDETYKSEIEVAESIPKKR